MIKGVGIVVPAHDEQDTLGACVASIREAMAALPPHIAAWAVVVLDDCTDRSAEVARGALGHHGDAMSVPFRNVGMARRAGACSLREHLASVSLSDLWFATTDADSRVPPSWLVDQLALADAGADAVAGTIQVVDWEDCPAERVRAFLDFYSPVGCSDAHGHVHGTNLGIRAEAYDAAGGFVGLESGEDHALWNALRRAGRKMLSTRRLPVVTSARRSGRAPRGFADFLARFPIADAL